MVSKRQASSECAANKWQASGKRAAVMLLPAQQGLGGGGFKGTLTPCFRGGMHSSPLSPSPKSCRVLGLRGGTHTQPGPPPKKSPLVPRVLRGGVGAAKRIYCSTQGALEAITFPPLDLNGF